MTVGVTVSRRSPWCACAPTWAWLSSYGVDYKEVEKQKNKILGIHKSNTYRTTSQP